MRVGPGDGAGRDVARLDRHLHDDPGLGVDRQEGRIGRGAFLAQGRQHDRHDLVEAGQHLEQGRVELAGAIGVGRGLELVVEAELVEEGAEPGVVMPAERVMRAERVRHLGQRLAEMLRQQLLVRDIVRHLAQAVLIVREGDQPRRDGAVGQHLKGVTHHRGARDLAERADMRQTGRAVTGLEHHLLLARFLQPRDELLGFLERPGGRDAGGFDQRGFESGHFGFRSRKMGQGRARFRRYARAAQQARRHLPGRWKTPA